MAHIDSPVTTDQARVGATSKALYTTPYLSSGEQASPVPIGVYGVYVTSSFSNTLPNPSYPLGLSNPPDSTSVLRIRQLFVRGTFYNSALPAATQGVYQVVKVSSAINPSGELTFGSTPFDTSYPTAEAVMIWDGANGLAFLSSPAVDLVNFGEVRQARQLGSHGMLHLRYSSFDAPDLLPGQSLCIKQVAAQVTVPDYLNGFVIWEEYAL